MFELALMAMSDKVDEVVSKSVMCLSSILKNPNFDEGFKAPLVARLMNNVWSLLNNNEMRSQVNFN